MTFSVQKDPEEVLDYTIDYTDIMNQTTPVDTIATSAWAISGSGIAPDMVIDSDTNDTEVATVWLSSGTRLGATFKATNHITTAGGREYDRTISVKVAEK